MTEWTCNTCEIIVYVGEDRQELDRCMLAHADVCRKSKRAPAERCDGQLTWRW